MSRARVSWAQLEINNNWLVASDTGTGLDSGLRSGASGSTVDVADVGVGADISNVATGGNQIKTAADFAFGFKRYAAAGLSFLYRQGESIANVGIGGATSISGTDSGVGVDSSVSLGNRTFFLSDNAGGIDSTFVSTPATATNITPTPLISFGWTSDPLDANVSWTIADQFLRAFSSKRGRSYEYSRMEAGQADYQLDNRDRRFDPNNAAGPYYPNVTPTRRVKLRCNYQSVEYPVIQGFTEGFPQQYPGDGMDAIVQQSATDWFYPLNTLKFVGEVTTLAEQITAVTQIAFRVTFTGLPMPQAFPFVIQVGTAPDVERMNVIDSSEPHVWIVERGYEGSIPRSFDVGTTIRAEAVRFGEEQSGTRIHNCLDYLGIALADRDIDAGNTLIAASENLINTAVLEHLLLIAECENGRLFVARDGKITFRERHRQFTQELSSRGTFGTTIPYLSQGVVLAQDDAKLYNRVKITIADGTIVEAFDQASIDQHMERTLEKQWPLASMNEAQDAADWMLTRLKQSQLRTPAIMVHLQGAHTPTVLGAEIGQRYHLNAAPPIVGTNVVSADVIIEGIAHHATAERWDATFELSEADPVSYWVVGQAGNSELDQTTVAAY